MTIFVDLECFIGNIFGGGRRRKQKICHSYKCAQCTSNRHCSGNQYCSGYTCVSHQTYTQAPYTTRPPSHLFTITTPITTITIRITTISTAISLQLQSLLTSQLQSTTILILQSTPILIHQALTLILIVQAHFLITIRITTISTAISLQLQ